MNPLFDKLWARGYSETNRANILSMIQKDSVSAFIDLGCDNGSLTIEVARKLGTRRVYGLEKNHASLAECRAQGVYVVSGDLDRGVPCKDNSFDLVLSNQVIEHVCHTDLLLREIHRILKPEGNAVISTNNITSWTNILAMIFGKQPFPNHVSDEIQTGRLLSRDEVFAVPTFAHRRIFSFPALVGLVKYHGFEIVEIKGSCFYPFWGKLERFLARLFPIYAAYIILKIRKAKKNT